MLKNILKIDGVLELNKTEQKSLQGGNPVGGSCYQKQGMCCMSWGSIQNFCDAGYCTSRGCVFH